jgi:uncharacterized protein (TIGR02996 family)
MTQLDKLLHSVVENPNDFSRRLILADFYEEEGQYQHAECQRWLAKHKKRAYAKSSTDDFYWFNTHKIGTRKDPESNLPEPLFLSLEGGKTHANHRWYDSRLESEEAVMLAWPKAIAKGWDLEDFPIESEEPN